MSGSANIVLGFQINLRIIKMKGVRLGNCNRTPATSSLKEEILVLARVSREAFHHGREREVFGTHSQGVRACGNWVLHFGWIRRQRI